MIICFSQTNAKNHGKDLRDMGNQALIKEAHYTTHIEGTRLTLDQAKRLWNGENVPEADPDDARELLNYRSAF
jgi:Fic family protein